MPAKTNPYFPRTEAAQIPWFGNLKTKVTNASYQTSLGYDAAEATLVQSICTLFIYILETYVPAARAYSEAITGAVDLLRTGTSGSVVFPTAPAFSAPAGSASLTPGLLKSLFEKIARWKTAAGYDDSIGDDLGIVGDSVEPTSAAPVLNITVGPDGVTLKFVKKGHMGVYIEGRRQGAESWVFLAIDTESPYHDTRPNLTPGQAEWREYRARYWDGTPVGDWSAVVRANVG
jgi:hypothetical protein